MERCGTEGLGRRRKVLDVLAGRKVSSHPLRKERRSTPVSLRGSYDC